MYNVPGIWNVIGSLREASTLTHCDGYVEILNDALPTNFSEPLVIGDGKIEAMLSDNGVVIDNQKDLIRLNGCFPYPKHLDINFLLPDKQIFHYRAHKMKSANKRSRYENCSVGSLSPDEVQREIRLQSKLNEVLGEYDLPPSLEHLAITHLDDGGCSLISKANGDIRLSEFIPLLNQGDVVTGYKEQLQRIRAWIGFSEGLVYKFDTDKSKWSNNLGNYVVYDVGGGYAISRVGFERKNFSNLPHTLRDINLGELNMRINDYIIKKELSSLVQERDSTFFSLGDKEEVVDDGRNVLILLTDKHFPNLDKDLVSFDKGFNGALPKRISKRFVHDVLNKAFSLLI